MMWRVICVTTLQWMVMTSICHYNNDETTSYDSTDSDEDSFSHVGDDNNVDNLVSSHNLHRRLTIQQTTRHAYT